MTVENVKAYLQPYGLADRVLEFDASSATVELAAAALHCEPCRIAKTLSFKKNPEKKNPEKNAGDGAGESALLVVAAGDAKIDNAKYKARFGCKAKMLTPEEAVRLVGHAVGGVCPFAVKDGVDIYLDESLRRFATVFPACGSANSAIELTVGELERCTPFRGWVDVCKGWQ